MSHRIVVRVGLAAALALLFLIPKTASAQGEGVLVGTVVDSATGRGLAGATVRVNAHGSEVAHEDGRFVFRRLRPGRHTVVAQYLGYAPDTATVTIQPGATTTVVLSLTVSAIQLNDLVVTGALSARNRSDVLSSVSSMAAAELDRKLDGTVGGTLKNEPGVAVSGISPSTARPVIRGMGGDRILVLEDGQRPGDMSSTSADHSVAIEPITAKSIEVVRGPMSLLYGSSALGGVVNVIRDEIPVAVPEHLHGSLTSQLSSVNRGITAGGYAALPLGATALRFEASGRTSGNVSTPIGEMVNTETRTLSAAAGVGAAPAWGHIGGSYRFYANDYGIPGGFVGGHEQGVDISMRRHTARLSASFHPDGQIDGPTIDADLAFTDYFHVEKAASGLIGTRFDQQMISGELRFHHGEHGLLTDGAAGLRAQYRDITTGGSLNTPSTYDISLAGYAIEEIGEDALRFQLGARYDWAHYAPREPASITTGEGEIPVRARTFGSVSGAAGVLYAPSDAVRIGTSISRAYRTPDFNELYSDGPHLAANSYDVGDPDLEEETGIGAEIFARYSGQRLQADAAVFLNELAGYVFPSSRGRVERGPQRGRPRLQFANEDARFSGIEAEVSWHVAPKWVLDVNASHVHAVFTSTRSPIPVFENQDTVFIQPSKYPPLIPPLNGRAELRYDTPRYFGGLGVQWAARQGNVGDFEEPTAAYVVPDLNAGIRLLRGSQFHTLTLRVDNILDAEYRQHLSRIKEILPEPGRNISLLYRVSI